VQLQCGEILEAQQEELTEQDRAELQWLGYQGHSQPPYYWVGWAWMTIPQVKELMRWVHAGWDPQQAWAQMGGLDVVST
jgi:hypothetical protein